MQTGTYISGLAHVAVIGWAVLGSVLSSPEPAPGVQVTDVSLISAASFNALGSAAPVPVTEVAQPDSPTTGQAAPDVPKAADTAPAIRPPSARPAEKPGSMPDLASITDIPRAEAQTTAPELAPEATTDTQGATLILPDAPIAPVERGGVRANRRQAMVAPAQPVAPKVDSRAAPKPPSDAEKARDAQKSTTPDPTAKTPLKPQKAKAPDQASTEIVTEAKQAKNAVAPTRSARPKGRPARLADRARATKAAKAAQARKDKQAKAIAAAIAKAQKQAPTPPAPTPSGPPLTRGEKEGLRLAVQECWNVNPSSEAARITVVVALMMEKNGKPVASSIRMVSASDGSASAKTSAYDAARRAILRCARSGYKLPVEKYERWRDIEITFNPDKMRIK